jgi:tetratricopeptide (TPR) repeat protein
MAKRAKKKSLPSQTDAVTPAITAPTHKARPAPTTGPTPSDVKLLLQAALILALGFCIYWPALNGGWLWDDRDLIADNALVHDPAGLWKIWFHPTCLFDYLPLKVSVEWIEWRLWGEDTLGYHLTNVGLHLLSAFLLWRLLHKFGLRHAWLGGLIFTIHPAMVESVAWISELKNTLSLPFFLLAMSAWLDYDARGKGKDYGLALGLFLLAMLCKPTMVMFPVVILLHAWWKRHRLGWPDLRASAPFFAVSIAMGLVTLWFLHRTAGEQIVVLGGVMSRLACAGLSISFYFSKCLLPLDLMPIYPQWIVNPPSPLQFLPWPVLGGVLYFLWTKRAGWGRHALLGLGFFLVNLAPFIGLNAASYMNYTWVMDHLLYIPIIGLIGLTVAGLGQMEAQLSATLRWTGATLMAVVLASMAWASHGYAKLYVDVTTQWEDNIARNPEAALPHSNLGFAFTKQGRLNEALDQFRLATHLDPRFGGAHQNLGLLLLQIGRVTEAVTELQAAVQLIPNVPETHYNLGGALESAGRIPEATEQYRQALALNPGYLNAYNNLAVALVDQNRLDEAIQVLQTAARIDPTNAPIQDNLAKAITMQNRQPAEARDEKTLKKQNPK